MKIRDRRCSKTIAWRRGCQSSLLLLAFGVGLIATSCASKKTSVVSTASSIASAPSGSSAVPEEQLTDQQFVDRVRALPAEKRQAYIASHSDQMQKVLDGPDVALAAQFSDLIPPPSRGGTNK